MVEFAETESDLEKIYGKPGETSLVKVADRITKEYRAWIEASPFCALATVGPEGLDCTPRGDKGRVVEILDPQTLAMPDRRGNNRIDTLRNIVRDPRVSVMFMVPGSNNVVRVNGTAKVAIDEESCAQYEMEGSLPRSVILIRVGEIYFQCARALLRAELWQGPVGKPDLPSPGQILRAMSNGDIDGQAYDREWPERAAKSMW